MDANEVVLLAEARTLAETGRGGEIRRQARLSMEDIARAVGTSRTTILRWEHGGRRPQGRPATRWASLLRELEEVSRD